ncbi:MAG: hypothetical protein ONA90_02190 [candidate division KSB1 bacterium]|nr:hypothetical protein [candidate division KSB1 bacterium]
MVVKKTWYSQQAQHALLEAFHYQRRHMVMKMKWKIIIFFVTVGGKNRKGLAAGAGT